MVEKKEIDKKFVEETINEILQIEDDDELIDRIKEFHAADIVRIIEEAPEDKTETLLKNIREEKLAKMIGKMEIDQKREVIETLKEDKLIEILDHMPTDEIVDLLGEVSIPKSKEILCLMKSDDARSVRTLMQYEESTAGSLMTTEYIAIKSHMNVEEALEKVKEIAPKTEVLDHLYIVDSKKNLVGALELRELFTNDEDRLIEDIMNENVISVEAHTDQEEVANTISKYDLLSIPIVNRFGKLVGIITVDDIIDVLKEEATEDFLKISGSLEPEEEITDRNFLSRASELQIFKARFPWLVIALFGGLLAGSVINLFRHSLQSVVILATFIPVIMAMGGNTGTQSSTIFIRTLTIEEITKKDFLKYVGREIKVGIMIGLSIGIGLGLVVFAWQGSTVLSGVVSLAIFLAITVANIVGLMIPWTLNSLGFDPAAASNPLITTLQDVIGLSIYFIVAQIFLVSI